MENLELKREKIEKPLNDFININLEFIFERFQKLIQFCKNQEKGPKNGKSNPIYAKLWPLPKKDHTSAAEIVKIQPEERKNIFPLEQYYQLYPQKDWKNYFFKASLQLLFRILEPLSKNSPIIGNSTQLKQILLEKTEFIELTPEQITAADQDLQETQQGTTETTALTLEVSNSTSVDQDSKPTEETPFQPLSPSENIILLATQIHAALAGTACPPSCPFVRSNRINDPDYSTSRHQLPPSKEPKKISGNSR